MTYLSSPFLEIIEITLIRHPVDAWARSQSLFEKLLPAIDARCVQSTTVNYNIGVTPAAISVILHCGRILMRCWRRVFPCHLETSREVHGPLRLLTQTAVIVNNIMIPARPIRWVMHVFRVKRSLQ